MITLIYGVRHNDTSRACIAIAKLQFMIGTLRFYGFNISPMLFRDG